MKPVNEMTREEFDKTQGKQPKKPKYGNRKVVIDGITFDSTAEGARYLQLRDMEERWLISYLRMQVKFILVEQTATTRQAVYIADFVYKNMHGVEIIEDVKGVKTALFRLKEKLMADKGYTLTCVTKTEIGPDWMKLSKDIRDTGLSYSTRKL